MFLSKSLRFLLLFAVALPLLPAQEKPPSSTSDPAVYLVFFRTPHHVLYSKPEVFHGVATDLESFLKEKNVSLKADPERPTIETESPMTVDSMLNIAGQVGASSLLFITVDHPMTRWLKVTVQAYDPGAKLLWQEEASTPAGWMGEKVGCEQTLEKIEANLSKHLGSPGLPVSAEAVVTPKPTAEGARP